MGRHLERCPDCRATHASLRARGSVEEEPGAHVPPALLLRWGRKESGLRGLERELVRRHVERCTECRTDLEALGYDVEFGTEPASELGFDPVARLAATGPSENDGSRFVDAIAGGARSLVDWWRSGQRGLGAMLVPSFELAPTRAGDLRTRIQVPRGTHAVNLPIRLPADVPIDEVYRVDLTGPDGVLVLSQETALRSLVEPNGLLLISGSDPIPDGLYRLELRRATVESLVFEIEIESGP